MGKIRQVWDSVVKKPHREADVLEKFVVNGWVVELIYDTKLRLRLKMTNQTLNRKVNFDRTLTSQIKNITIAADKKLKQLQLI